MDLRLIVLLALAAVAAARPMESVEEQASIISPIIEIEREKRQPEPQDRQDYGYQQPSYEPSYQPEPSYKPEPYKADHYKPHLPAQIKSFVKTDYHANFKWGVK